MRGGNAGGQTWMRSMEGLTWFDHWLAIRLEAITTTSLEAITTSSLEAMASSLEAMAIRNKEKRL